MIEKNLDVLLVSGLIDEELYKLAIKKRVNLERGFKIYKTKAERLALRMLYTSVLMSGFEEYIDRMLDLVELFERYGIYHKGRTALELLNTVDLSIDRSEFKYNLEIFKMLFLENFKSGHLMIHIKSGVYKVEYKEDRFKIYKDNKFISDTKGGIVLSEGNMVLLNNWKDVYNLKIHYDIVILNRRMHEYGY